MQTSRWRSVSLYTGPVASSSAKAPTGYQPSLDGWRAVAILGVLMDHDAPWSFRGHTNAHFHEYGGWGVYLFFAISGLLVTTRILADESRFGKFLIGRFYIRRLFRIQPAAIFYLGVVSLCTWIGFLHQKWSSILGSLFLYQNYLFHAADVSGSWFLTGHFWTLAVEEHFYLLLSLLLFFCTRHRIRVFAGLLLLVLTFQEVAKRLNWNTVNRSRQTEYVINYLIAPALIALLLQRPSVRSAVIKYLRPWVAFVGTLIAKVLWSCFHPGFLQHNGRLAWLTSPSYLLLYPFDLWVVATVYHPKSWTTRILETAPLRLVGRLSYSLYLWHVFFFVSRLPQVEMHTLTPLTQRPWRYVATAAMALFSYYCIERPFIRLGHRIAPPATAGHADLGDGQQPA